MSKYLYIICFRYSNIGVFVLITMIINIFSPQFVPALILEPLQRFRQRLYTDQIIESGTQLELNNLYSGAEFSLAERYAVLLNTFFTTFLFSAGLPILNSFACLSFITTYWFDKYSCMI